MNNNSPKNILYWSHKCPFSTSLIQRIRETPIMNTIILCSVHDKTYQIPQFVKSVPTLWFSKQRKILTDDDLTQWVNMQLYQLQQSRMNQQQSGMSQQQPEMNQRQSGMNQPQMMNRNMNNQYQNKGPAKKTIHMGDDDLSGEKRRQLGPIIDFNPAEMGTSFSESYSFLDNPDATSSQNFTFIGEADDVPPITTIKGNSADLGDFPTQNNNNGGGMGGGMSNGMGNGMGNGMNGMDGGNYNPFSDNSDPRMSSKENELNQKLDKLMQSRDMEDSLSTARM